MIYIYINSKNPSLMFLPVYKCSQDHLELVFGSIRSHGGYNNNPTCRQFIAAYKKLLIHSKIRENGLENCIPLNQINILNCSNLNKKPEDLINNSCSFSSNFLEHPSEDKNTDCGNIDNDHDYLFENNILSQYSEEVVTYIAGFVSRKLSRSLACESCVGALFGVKENLMSSLIKVKDRGALTYRSDGVIKICIVCEKMFRRESSQHKLYKIRKAKLVQSTIAQFLHTTVFEKLQSCSRQSSLTKYC